MRCNKTVPVTFWVPFAMISLLYSHFAFAASSNVLQKIEDAAARAQLDPRLVEAVVKVESNFESHVTSKKGAMGLMQVIASAADECQIRSPYHALDNLMGACDCLRRLINRYQGNLKLALAAYNAGSHAVDKYQGVPPYQETQKYVDRVLEIYRGKGVGP